MFTGVTSLLLVPQCVILCALLAGFFCFFPVIYLFMISFLVVLFFLTYAFCPICVSNLALYFL